MQNARMDDSNWNQDCQDISYLRYADDTTLMVEREEEIKSLLMRVKEDSEKAGLKLNIKKTKILAVGPITSWKIWGKSGNNEDFIFLGSKITVDSDCSHEMKRCLLLERKAVINLDSVLKSRDITLMMKVHLVIYGCESWIIKKAECQTIDPLWC